MVKKRFFEKTLKLNAINDWSFLSNRSTFCKRDQRVCG